jgi:hypothetical protein
VTACVGNNERLGILLKRVVQFTGVSRGKTVLGWYERNSPPEGTVLLKLRAFLSHWGCTVTELEQLNPTVRKISTLVGWGVVTPEELATLLGNRSAKHLVAVLQGRENTSAQCLTAMEQLYTRYAASLQKKVSEYNTLPAVGEMPPTARPQKPSVRKHDPIAILAHLINATLPLAELVNSDSFTAEDRRRLHELAGSNTVFNAANELNRLCSEKARQVIAQPQTTGE